MDILQTIIERTRADLVERKRTMDLDRLHEQIQARGPARDFAGSLKQLRSHANVIAELKRASPSKGLIRPDFRPLEFGPQLQAAGAAALSVLTEPHWFQGSLEILAGVAERVQIPVLRKDFIVDPFQLLEARAAGADAVLLIAAGLSEPDYARLLEEAQMLGLQVLTEVHSTEELERVLRHGAEVIGVNARNLRTFEIDMELLARLVAAIPAECVRVAESGIKSPEDIAKLSAIGADAFLIGETVMRAGEPGDNLRMLLGAKSPTQHSDKA